MAHVNANRLLLLAIGSDIHRDVGIPARLVNDLKMTFDYEEMDYESVYLGGLDLLEYINGYKAVIFIDTIKTEVGDPGKIHHFSPENYRETLHLSCRHDTSFHMTIQLGKKLGFALPANIHIIAIEIIEDLEIGSVLSKDLKDRYPVIRSEVKKCIEEFYKEISTEI